MRLKIASVMFMCCISLSVPSLAATVVPIQGQVLINRGGGFTGISGPTEVAPGDSVTVNAGGSAQIVYGDGSVVNVQPGSVATVTAQPPSNAGVLGEDTTTFVVGAAVVGGGIGAAVLLSDDDDDDNGNNGGDSPASP